MFIPADQIKDWRDLQNRVAQLFTEVGYLVTTPKTVELAGRGRKEVDVYIEDPRASVNQIMLVECKLWNTRVDQEEVHSMHTVMVGSGANTGFIISKVGFQSGAYEAAANTNIHLLTWEELQHRFGRQWFLHRRDELKPLISELRGIDQAFMDQSNSLMTISNTIQFDATGLLRELYDTLVLSRIAIFAAMGGPKSYDDPGPFDIIVEEGFQGSIQDASGIWVVRLGSARDYFDWLMDFSRARLEAFRALLQSAQQRFDALPDQGTAAFQEALKEIAEETPIRLFRDALGSETYERLIADTVAKRTKA